MGSSEIVDSGRFGVGRSNFSHTCSLLSQYLKEKGSFGDLSLGLTHNFDSKGVAPSGTMNLLPMIEKSVDRNQNMPLYKPALHAAGRGETQKKSDLSGTKSEAETAQMTIFYAGQVIVFNDFPADKAKEIMVLAGKSSPAQNHHPATFAPPCTAQSPTESVTGIPNIAHNFVKQERPHQIPQPPLGSDLPIARKNSLARFLEKRKDRITENAPYQAIKAEATTAEAEAEAWLGLGPQFPLQFNRH